MAVKMRGKIQPCSMFSSKTEFNWNRISDTDQSTLLFTSNKGYSYPSQNTVHVDMRKNNKQRHLNNGNYDQNDGVPGVVYILRNESFKDDWLKIGQSRHSGHIRAQRMNREASTGLPAHHVCVFECRTLDCGRAEKSIFTTLRDYRKGRQEFFEIDIKIAKTIIIAECHSIDVEILHKNELALKKRKEFTSQTETINLTVESILKEDYCLKINNKLYSEVSEIYKSLDGSDGFNGDEGLAAIYGVAYVCSHAAIDIFLAAELEKQFLTTLALKHFWG